MRERERERERGREGDLKYVITTLNIASQFEAVNTLEIQVGVI